MFMWWFLLYLGNPQITLILVFIGKLSHFYFFFFFGYPLEVFVSYGFQVAKDLRLSCSVILTCMHISTWTRSPVKLVRLRAPLPLLPTTSFWFSRSTGDSYCSWGSQGKNTEVLCHSLLQWTTFCQTSPPWHSHLGWPHMKWLSFIELNKAVVSVIRLASCLWL